MSPAVKTTEVPADVEPGPDREELAALRDSVHGVCSKLWPDATSALTGDLDGLWKLAAQQGWTDFGDPAFIVAAIAVQQELGALACPLPIVDAALCSLVLNDRDDTATVGAIASGEIRPIVAVAPEGSGDRLVRHVEVASAGTHLLVIDEVADKLSWFELAQGQVSEASGLAVPAWSDVTLPESSVWTAPLTDYRDLLILRRLGLAGRAVTAARRAHDLAVEHAKQRQQFGKPIGAFQAVSHRLVNAQSAFTAAEELLAHVHELRSAGDESWQLAAEIYLEFVRDRLAGLQFDAHHTLAAIGYFEEHEAPWLFRRVHADLAALSASGTAPTVGDYIVDEGRRLPDYDRGPSADRIREEVLEAFEPWMNGPPSHLRSWDDEARAVLRDRDWIGVGWPKEFGGGGWPVGDVLAFSEALAYANPPLGNIMMGVNSIVPMLIKKGSPQLRDLVMAEVRKGDLSIALGYSEPEAGSDLASLRTRAERTEGGWIIKGQKMWGTCFPDSKWVMLAARTDADAKPRHAGISLFLVDTDSPGIEVSPHTSLGGDVSATTFWDNVFVPEDRLVGDVNEGWTALMTALAGERVLIGASVMRAHRAFDRLVGLVVSDPQAVVPSRRRAAKEEIGRLAVRLQAARALINRAVRSITTGANAPSEPPMAKIAATELAEDLNATAISLLGPDALYGWGVEGAAGDGYFEDGLRASIMSVIAGGTGDIQRGIVARAMGLPRS